MNVNNTIDRAVEMVRDRLEDTTRWRREKASEYPDDLRNVSAYQTCERLLLDTGPVPAETAAKYLSLYEGDEGYSASELENEVFHQSAFSLSQAQLQTSWALL